MAVYEPDLNFAPIDQARAVVESGESTFYLYDEAGIRGSMRRINQLFANSPNFCNYFSIRENCNPSLLCILQECDSGVIACCEAELRLAQHCGFLGGKLLYQPIKADSAAAALAVTLDAGWLITSPELLPDIPVSRVFLRYLQSQIEGAAARFHNFCKGKFGFSRQELFSAVRRLKEQGTDEIGLEIHSNTYTLRPGILAAKTAVLFSLLEEIREKTGVTIFACNIGDGPSLSYQQNCKAPPLEQEVRSLLMGWQSLSADIRPILHTAMSAQVMEPHGLLLSQILQVREYPIDTLVLDASVSQYLRLILKKAYRHMSILGRNSTEDRVLYLVGGCIPEDFDVFAVKKTLPRVVPGDICVIHATGCGGRALPMLYGTRPLCGEYLLTMDGTVRQIGQRRTEQEVMAFLTTW